MGNGAYGIANDVPFILVFALVAGVWVELIRKEFDGEVHVVG